MLCIGSKFTLVKFIFLLPGNGKDYGNEFLQKKNILGSVPLCLLHRKLQVPYWKIPYVVFLLKQAYNFLYQLLIVAYEKDSFLQTLYSSFISINNTSIESSILRNSILEVNQRSSLKICRQLDENLHTITFAYRTVLDL